MYKLSIMIVILLLLNSCRESINIKAQNQAQTPKIKLVKNANVMGENAEQKEVLKLWEEMINKSLIYISDDNLSYWVKSEHFEAPNTFMAELYNVVSHKKNCQATIIALIPTGKDVFLIKTMITTTSDSTKTTQLEYIYSVEAVKTNEGFKFRSLPQQYYQNWKKKTVGTITFCYDSSRVFNETLAMKLDSFNRSMSQLFKLDIQLPIYFVGKNIFEAYQIMGYDFNPIQATTLSTGGITDTYNGVIFGGNNTEYYPHEIVHLYLAQYWGKDGLYHHEWFNEGIAVLFGDNLDYHINIIKTYLAKHPEEPLNDISTFHFNINDEYYSNFMYEIGGLICKRVYDKEGMKGLFDLLKSGSTDDDFYKAIEKHFGVKKENFGAFIKKELETI
jgi:hypothetical protein